MTNRCANCRERRCSPARRLCSGSPTAQGAEDCMRHLLAFYAPIGGVGRPGSPMAPAPGGTYLPGSRRRRRLPPAAAPTTRAVRRPPHASQQLVRICHAVARRQQGRGSSMRVVRANRGQEPTRWGAAGLQACGAAARPLCRACRCLPPCGLPSPVTCLCIQGWSAGPGPLGSELVGALVRQNWAADVAEEGHACASAQPPFVMPSQLRSRHCEGEQNAGA